MEGPRPLVTDLVASENVAIDVTAVARAVVSEHAFDPNTDLGEAGNGQLDRPRGTLAALVGDGHHDGIPAGVVDEHLEVVVADASAVTRMGMTLAAEHSPATAVRDPSELLVVLVDEGSRMTGHVADRSGGHPVGVTQPVEAGPAEDAVDRRAGMARERRQAGRAIASPSPRSKDRRSHGVGRAAWRVMRSRAPIFEPRQAVGPIPADPLVCRRPADPELLGDGRRWPAVDHHPFHQQLSTEDR